jgi:hypothetical protein
MALEDMNSVSEDMKLKVNVFFKAFDLDGFPVGVDLVCFGSELNTVSGTIRGVVMGLMGDEVVSVAFELEVFSFRMPAFMIIRLVDVAFDVSVSFILVSDDSNCDDTTSDEVFPTGDSSNKVAFEDVVFLEITSSDIVSLNIASVHTVSENVDSENLSGDINPNDVSNDITSQFIDLSRNPGSGLGAIECGAIE